MGWWFWVLNDFEMVWIWWGLMRVCGFRSVRLGYWNFVGTMMIYYK
jgi:hypothetical protein